MLRHFDFAQCRLPRPPLVPSLSRDQHARIFVHHFKSISARPEPVEGLRVSFSTACKMQNYESDTIAEHEHGHHRSWRSFTLNFEPRNFELLLAGERLERTPESIRGWNDWNALRYNLSLPYFVDQL